MKKTAKPKLIKDIVHGYIELESDYVKLIDTPEFQRLKNIRQTSYTALYPSSSHDRFSHSLGVFALGKYAFDYLKKNIIEDYPSNRKLFDQSFWINARNTFLSACLLHDVGHAPFSHTAEDFFKIPVIDNVTQIYHDLIEAVNDPIFSADYPPLKQDLPKAHEIMSATIGIKLVEECDLSIDKSLFARMIIGIPFSVKPDFKYCVYNALISLLNSDIIDVDRLDYIMRDTMMTGYKSVSIDINRLLSSVCLVSIPPADKEYTLGFYKNAVSIIENVIIAHDLERRWVQNHATIAYDTILIQNCIKEIEASATCVKEGASTQQVDTTTDNKADADIGANTNGKEKPPSKENRIFRQEALSVNGIQINNNGGYMDGCTIRLLCDSDILFLAKQLPEDNKSREMINEYFDRRIRKKAIWKTEMHFSNLMRNLGDNNKNEFLFDMRYLFTLLSNLKSNVATEDYLIINKNSKTIIAEEYDKKRSVKNLPVNKKSEYDDSQKRLEAAIDVFKEVCDKCNIQFDLVIKRFTKFSSGTSKLDKDKIYIKYGKNNSGTSFKNLLDTYRLKNNEHNEVGNTLDNDIYYIYCKYAEKDVDPMKFIKAVLTCYKSHKHELKD